MSRKEALELGPEKHFSVGSYIQAKNHIVQIIEANGIVAERAIRYRRDGEEILGWHVQNNNGVRAVRKDNGTPVLLSKGAFFTEAPEPNKPDTRNIPQSKATRKAMDRIGTDPWWNR